MKTRMVFLTFAVVLVSAISPVVATGNRAEVIHWWISGGESAALKVIIKEFEKRGNQWVDTPVEASYQAKTTALSRLFAGNPPTVVQWHVGPTIKDLFNEGLLRNVQSLAESKGWKSVLPTAIWKNITVEGRVVVLPITLHGSNWLWSSRVVLEKVGVRSPKTWKEFLSVSQKIKKAGYVPLALGGQPWQESILFINVVLALEGPQFYRDVFEWHKQEALLSQKMVKAFEAFGELRQFVDSKSPKRGWVDTTDLIISNKAAFQVMGDWAKGEFNQAKLKPGKDYNCEFFPGTENAFIAVSDAFAMVNVKNKDEIAAQQSLAEVMMDPEVQRRFNIIKGSIPPRKDTALAGFDSCAIKGIKSLRNKETQVVPSMNMANKEITSSTFQSSISAFWNDPGADPALAASKLAEAIKKAKM